ncbi:PREDICTED: P2Y purinoceptor 14-like [Poecilia mexicana]|uniref:P2Y purinoceptor 14-like n=1 Tax=Poecilia mexicana TaxID=48701 RepID=UPI00072DC8F1|nr:PREDICTED: P2Y purinoceptor 14-like [Poecilia mexicana]
MDATTSSIQESNDHNSTCDLDVKSYHSFLVVVYSLLFLVGLSLNSFTLWFHCRGAHGHASKSWMIYLKHLTAADFLACISLPMRIIYYASSSFIIHLLYCSVGAPLFFLNWAASILFMGYIAANRYMKISYSSETHFLMTAKASHIISITTWVVLLTMTTPYTILMLISEEHHDDEHSTCDHLIIETVKLMHTMSHVFAFIIFLSGLSSLIYFYNSASRRVLQVQQTQLASSNSKRLVKSRRNMLVLVIVFCLCFVPYHIVQLPYVILQGKCSVVLYYIKEFAVFLSVSNICLDPLIYVFLCKDFRAQFNLKQIFCPKRKRNTCSLEASVSGDQLNTINTSSPINTMSELQGQRGQ